MSSDGYRKPIGDEIGILEDDGHNSSTFHIFRSMSQAVDYIIGKGNEIAVQWTEAYAALSEDSEWCDSNNCRWIVSSGVPYTIDHTEKP